MSRVGPERPPFDPLTVSPSRLNSFSSCGVAFKMHYIDRLPPQRSGSAALFGNVVHKALETWALDRSQELVPLMRAAWRSETEGTAVHDFISEYEGMVANVLRAEKRAADAFLEKNGRETQAARMTKVFKDSPEAKAESKLLAKWLPKLQADSPWRFTERDPAPKLYGESLVLAKRHQARYRSFPDALFTELRFDVAWEGFILTGFIDSIEPVIEDGELVFIDVIDYKTYAKESPGAKDWRQGAVYHVAIHDLVRRGSLVLPGVVDGNVGVPIRVTFDYPRLGTRRHYYMGEADEKQLLSELTMYRAAVENNVFLPAEKGRNPDFCDYPENCCLNNRGNGCAGPVEVEVPLVL